MSRRIERMTRLAQKEISSILLKDINDPRIGFVTVTDVAFSKDFTHMKVFVSVYG